MIFCNVYFFSRWFWRVSIAQSVARLSSDKKRLVRIRLAATYIFGFFLAPIGGKFICMSLGHCVGANDGWRYCLCPTCVCLNLKNLMPRLGNLWGGGQRAYTKRDCLFSVHSCWQSGGSCVAAALPTRMY